MKKSLLKTFASFVFIVLIFGTFSSFVEDHIVITENIISDGGRCTGSSYCSACSNCSRCNHCNSGGSCDVCSSRSNYSDIPSSNTRSKSYYPSSTSKSSSISTSNSKNTALRSSEIYNLTDDIFSENYSKTLKVNAITLNLRKGPGSNYAIIEKLYNNQKLLFLASKGEWVKVRVQSSNNIGFVHYKYVLLFSE